MKTNSEDFRARFKAQFIRKATRGPTEDAPMVCLTCKVELAQPWKQKDGLHTFLAHMKLHDLEIS